ALDGDSGAVFADPDTAVADRFQAAIAKAEAEKRALTAYKDVTPRRADGTVIDIAANIGSLEEIDAAKEAGA
ncbi:hypothetical protein LXJ59_27805, partial [Escherichia coli]|nr:hypothetical protein [Escherichia coli]